MSSLYFTSQLPQSLDVDALVVAVAQTADGPKLLATGLPDELQAQLAELLPRLGVSGKTDEVVRLTLDAVAAPIVVTSGVGNWDEVGEPDGLLEQLRRAAGAALRQLAGLAEVGLAFPVIAGSAAAVGLGALLGAYRFDRYKELPEPVARIGVVSDLAEAEAEALASRSEIVAQAVATIRDLVNQTANELYPETFASLADELVADLGIELEILDEHDLVMGGYGGLLAVGRGSTRPPRLVKLHWSPEGAGRHIALVGKGITYDSGGLSLKTNDGMKTMKSDMTGAATVLATIIAAARLELPVAISGYMALAENMPSGSAGHVGDVIRIFDGTSVEVMNTDAEGRLVLADGLSAAVAEPVDAVIDLATLTGAQIIALGERTAGIMGSPAVRDALVAAADRAGEEAWPMPLPGYLKAALDSPIADFKNVAGRPAGMLTAGIFLQHFVGDTPWAHIDLAGPAFNEETAWGYTPQGGTGYGLRTLLAYLEELAAPAE